ncbi:hydrolase [Croceiramulus getboli]|nr:hydrolase [Flavobacteriaceae bacterium YJPT1-3]
MKRQIFLYLFLFAALWIIFQYANQKKIFGAQEAKIASLQEEVEQLTDSLNNLQNELSDANYFTLKNNENAYDYFDRQGFEVDGLSSVIADEIYALNTTKGNVLIPFEGMNRPMQVNKVQILNHRWLIADFSDGNRWGELLVRYEIKDNSALHFEVVDSLVYPKS